MRPAVRSEIAVTGAIHSNRYRDGGYLEKVPEWHAGDSAWKAGKVLELLRRNSIVCRSLCDVGCGAGEILAHLQAALGSDVRLVGYDISPQAIAFCHRRENATLTFKLGDFLSEDRDDYDVVLLLDVLEHIPDYLDFLARLRRHAGWLVFHIPLDINAEAVLRRSRPMLAMREQYGHLHYFTAETALATLTDAGYSVRDYFFTWDTEIGGRPKPPLGFRSRLRYPLTCVIYYVEKLAFRWRPDLMARLRKRYNLMVLARVD